MRSARLVPLNSLFEAQQETEDQLSDNQQLIDAVDSLIQTHMGDLSKVREMYNELVRQVGDSESVKQTFMERVGNMIHATDEQN